MYVCTYVRTYVCILYMYMYALQSPLSSCSQQDHLVPFLVSIGCKPGKDLSPLHHHHHPIRPRAVSSPHEPPSCRKLHSPEAAPRRRSAQALRCELGGSGDSSSEEVLKGSDSDLSRRMERHIDRRFDCTQSLKPDEAFAIGLQKQEIAKFR